MRPLLIIKEIIKRKGAITEEEYGRLFSWASANLFTTPERHAEASYFLQLLKIYYTPKGERK